MTNNAEVITTPIPGEFIIVGLKLRWGRSGQTEVLYFFVKASQCLEGLAENKAGFFLLPKCTRSE